MENFVRLQPRIVAQIISQHPLIKQQIRHSCEGDSSNTSMPTRPSASPSWCKCGMCRCWVNQKKVERQCCRKTVGDCGLLDDDLVAVVLRPAVVRAAVNSDRMLFARTVQYSNKTMRHQTYAQFVYHVVGPTGAGKRVVVPACIVAKIRQQWPSETDSYTGFRKSSMAGGQQFGVALDSGRYELPSDDDEDYEAADGDDEEDDGDEDTESDDDS